MTESLDFAKEWAVYQPEGANGWVHKFALETEGLKILDFQGNVESEVGQWQHIQKHIWKR